MKIVHISVYPTKGDLHKGQGGVASYTKNLVTHAPSDHEVYILCNKIDGRRETYQENGVTVIRCFDRHPRYIVQLLQEIKKLRPDVIHVQQELYLFGGVLTGYLLQWFLFLLRSYKIVMTLHGVVSLKLINKDFVKENNAHFPISLVRIAFYMIYKPLCLWANFVIVHADYFKNILIAEYGVKSDKIIVLPHGVEEKQTIERSEACARLLIDSSRRIVLFMGYLTGYKGIDLLLEGFGEYAKENPNAYLIVGAGIHPKLTDDQAYRAEYQRLMNKAQALISKEQYRWVGFIPEEEITTYFSAADVSVYPYTICMSASGPMAIAIAHNKPFLASDVFREFFAKEHNIVLFQKNPESLARKLADFFERSEEYLRIVKELKGRQLWQRVSNETYNLYQAL